MLFRAAVLCTLLAQLLLLPRVASVATDTASNELVVCDGTLESDHTTTDSVQKLKKLRDQLSGCQFVIGDIHIVRINQSHFDRSDTEFNFDFLKTIQEVTGSVKLVDSCFSMPLEFPNLQVIRGAGSFNSSLVLQFDPNCQEKTPFVAFPSLRLVGGGVILYGVTSCYIERHINFNELFAYPLTPVVKRIHNCSQLEDKCHENCTTWPEDGRKHCWGPEQRHCQPRTRCQARSPADCPYQRCFVDSQGGERCCSTECLGGCFGSQPNQCFGCKHFNKNGSCVHSCEKTHTYSPGSAHMVKADEKPLLPLGPVCVAKCPAFYFKEEGTCVRKCLPEKAPNDDGVCVPMNASRLCEIKSDGISNVCHVSNPLLQGLKNESLLCTEYHGSATIDKSCFDDSMVEGFQKITIEQLYIMFSRVRVVRGEIQVNLLNFNGITNLTFLSRLERLDDRSGETNGGRLLIFPSVQFLGLVSLSYVKRPIRIHLQPAKLIKDSTRFCRTFLPKSAAVDEGLIQVGSNTSTVVKVSSILPNSADVKCPFKSDTCDPQCDPRFGCWGPGPTNCVRCRHVKAGSICTESCSSESGWFLPEIAALTSVNDSNAERLCSPCHNLCSQCTGPSRGECTECREGAYLTGNTCVTRCDQNEQFEDAEMRVCRPCPKVCTPLRNGKPTCTGNATVVGHGGCQFCTHVFESSATDGSNGTVLTCIESGCPSGFYKTALEEDSAHLRKFNDFVELQKTVIYSVTMCLKCAPHCLTCKVTSTACTACRYYSVESETPGEDTCETVDSPKCRDGFYPDNANRTCRPCSSPCNLCSGPGSNNCLRCVSSKYALPNQSNGKVLDDLSNDTLLATVTCVDTCPEELPHAVASDRGLVCSDSPYGFLFASLIGVACLAALAVAVGLPVTICCCLRRQRRSDASLDEEKEELEPILNRGYLTTISENELVRGPEVGSGAFGTVYKGEWNPADSGDGCKTTVAIKILSDTGDRAMSSELLEESRIMASVDHPHCVRLVGICMTQPLQLVSQFMPLGNLRDFLRTRREPGQVSAAQLLRYAAQIASGMSHLERCNIIHRDLACRNVLVSSSRCVRITDFGLAKALDNASQEYRASGGKLPVKWLALESLISRRFTHKSDVWSYGVTLWEIFTFGESPYLNVRPQDLADYLEKGERLPQPDICMLDVYMLMIKCWMLDEHYRPTFDELEGSFTRMCSQPERFIFSRAVRHSSHCSGGSGGGVKGAAGGGSCSRSPRHSNNNNSRSSNRQPSLDELDNAYVDMGSNDLENDVFDESEAGGATALLAPSRQLMPSLLSLPPPRQHQHQLPTAPPPPLLPEEECSPEKQHREQPCQYQQWQQQQRSFSVSMSGRRRATGPPPPLLTSGSPQNQYTLDPCRPGPSSGGGDYYLQPMQAAARSPRENPLPLPPRQSAGGTPSRLAPPPLPLPLPSPVPPPLASSGSPGQAFANPEYFFQYSVGSGGVDGTGAGFSGGFGSDPTSSNDSGIASPKFSFAKD